MGAETVQQARTHGLDEQVAIKKQSRSGKGQSDTAASPTIRSSRVNSTPAPVPDDGFVSRCCRACPVELAMDRTLASHCEATVLRAADRMGFAMPCRRQHPMHQDARHAMSTPARNPAHQHTGTPAHQHTSTPAHQHIHRPIEGSFTAFSDSDIALCASFNRASTAMTNATRMAFGTLRFADTATATAASRGAASRHRPVAWMDASTVGT